MKRLLALFTVVIHRGKVEMPHQGRPVLLAFKQPILGELVIQELLGRMNKGTSPPFAELMSLTHWRQAFPGRRQTHHPCLVGLGSLLKDKMSKHAS
jgi:hypothetical protein